MSEPEPCPHSTIKESSKATAHAVDCRNGTEDPEVNGTLQAKESGMSLNLNNVVRVAADVYNQTVDSDTAPTVTAAVGGTNTSGAKVLELSCGNPWDSQSERVYHGDGAWHSLNANSGGGQNRDAVLAFAQNQRDEVRDLKDVAGSLAAEPGMKQQTFVAGFSFGQSEKARSLGYQVEMSPTLRGGEGGNQKPVLVEVKKE
ncbi:MAG: hypothetical protein IKK82_13035 [Kiritimatiellae bacterium]|nr:hypothetical protein [Kiritimatiellia bacterium]